jgi:hypothetical protein
MSSPVELFISRVPDFSALPSARQNEILAYSLHCDGKAVVTVAEVDAHRLQLKLPPFPTAKQFSLHCKGIKGKGPRFVKATKGYSLARGIFEELDRTFGQRPAALTIKHDLAKHIAELADPNLKDYLQETVNCFDHGYYRASIVMAWCAGFAILRDWLYSRHLAAMNAVMAKWKSPRHISKIEDFEELSERVVLDTARTATVVTKEQHKQLVALLDQRNSFAHPTGRKCSAPVAEAYLTQILDEVIVNFR